MRPPGPLCRRRSFPPAFLGPQRLRRALSLGGDPPAPTPRAAQILQKLISAAGPISVASFMRHCLASPVHGYYTSRSPLGARGDFTTSPEISQMFGELVAVWMIHEWVLKDRPPRIAWVELGPGRGTLADDYLRTAATFRDYFQAIESLRLVEISPVLRELQRQLLCGTSPAQQAGADVWRCMSKYGIPVYWYERLDQLPAELPTPFVAANEFFDSMPIHMLEKTAHGWRELLVDLAPQDALHAEGSAEKPPASSQFRLVLSKRPTYHSLALPNISQRYASLPAGSCIEVSPESLLLMERISRILANNSEIASGSALIIDYGPSDTIPVHTLRGIRSHRMVSPFEEPGEVDLSSDVDFQALKEVALRHDGLQVYGPIEQGTWLKTMGIELRAKALMDASKDTAGKKRIESSYKRLIERGGGAMGKVYKFMAVVSKREQLPAGFY